MGTKAALPVAVITASPLWNRPADRVLADLDTSGAGLTRAEASARLVRYGPNQLRATRRRTVWSILVAQVKSLIVVLLAAAALASAAFGDWLEAVSIAAVIVINVAIGFVTELRAIRSMEALRKLGTHSVRVRRGDCESVIPGIELVPGDIVLVEGGDVVTADMRVLEAAKLSADESALTGESVPVSKHSEPVVAEAPLAERKNMLYKGTAITRGSGTAVVVATGMDSELGRIARLVRDADEALTPLEERLEALGRRLIWISLAMGGLATAAGIATGKSMLLMIETGVALTVAAIPEGLPIVATMALARGMWRMALRHALINHLAAVETLGATSIIVTDKTGTLTENQLTVTRIATAEGVFEVTGEGLSMTGEFRCDGAAIEPRTVSSLRTALEIAVLCNNAALRRDGTDVAAVGDPLEVALLAAGMKAGMARGALLVSHPEVREEAFEPQTRMMATYHRPAGSAGAVVRVAVKGAVGAVVDHSTMVLTKEGVEPLTEDERARWLELNRGMAAQGLRVLAVAEKQTNSQADHAYESLVLVGLVAMRDPPRAGVREAIELAQRAGVRIVMATGDQPVTALAIARAVGLAGATDAVAVTGRELGVLCDRPEVEQDAILASSIFARVDPEQKLDLIEGYQRRGHVVAMTGDGVNDAPALKKADIGVAMGKRGTDVAREAADVVLTDDALSSIVFAIRQGRVIYDNIQRFVLYLLSCNAAEILAIGLALAVALPLPILPLQILFLNLVTDVFPALALGFSGAGSGVMERRPRDRHEGLLTRRHWTEVLVYALVMATAVIASLRLAEAHLGYGLEAATTVSFLTLALSQLWHVLNMRGPRSRLFVNEVTGNGWIWGAVGLCLGLLLSSVYVPPLARALKTVAPDGRGWALALSLSLVPVAFGQLWRLGRALVATKAGADTGTVSGADTGFPHGQRRARSTGPTWP